MTSRAVATFTRHIVATLVLLLALPGSSLLAQKSVHVKGYVKRDGTVVKPYAQRGAGGKAPVPPPSPAPPPPTPPPAEPAAPTPPTAERPETTPPAVVRVVSPSDDARATV